MWIFGTALSKTPQQRAWDYKDTQRAGRVQSDLVIEEYGYVTSECRSCWGTGQRTNHYGGRCHLIMCDMCDGRGRTETFTETLLGSEDALLKIQREGMAIRRLCAKNPKVEGETPHYCWEELDAKRKEYREEKDLNDKLWARKNRYDDPNQPNELPKDTGPKYVRTVADDWADFGWDIMKGFVGLYLFCFAIVPGCGI